MTTTPTPMLHARTLCALAISMNPNATEQDRNLLALYLRGVVRAAVEQKRGGLNFNVWRQDHGCGTVACLGGWFEIEMDANYLDADSREWLGIGYGTDNDWFGTSERGTLRDRAHRIHAEIDRRGLRLPDGAVEMVDGVLS